MQSIQNAIIEDFGLGYVKFGHSELMGRVVGLLLCTAEAISIDEICSALDVTKTPINQICRRLEERNLIRRIRISGQRKYYYQITQDVFLQAGINLSRLYEDNLRIAETHLQTLLNRFNQASGEEKDMYRIVCERLICMREFHLRQVQAYQRFVNEWRSAKYALPTVEEYAKNIGMQAA